MELKEFVGNKIKHLRTEHRMTQGDLADKLGTTKQTISRYENGIRKANQDVLFELCNVFDVTIDDFFPQPDVEDIENANIILTPFVNVPVLGEIACGEPIDAEENITEYRSLPKDRLPSGKSFYLKAKGNSMEPKIPDGSYVLCREQPDVENGEIAAVLVNGDEEATLKRVIKQNNTILLQALNEAYAPYIVDSHNPARIIGKAIQVETVL